MLSTIMRPMLGAMDGRDFRSFMEAFLRYADHGLGKVFNYAWSLGMFLGPIVALVLLWDDRGSTSFVLTAIGLVDRVRRCDRRLERVEDPDLQADLGWDPEALPADWEAGRQRYFAINWIQMATTWSAFALFLVALGYL
jgi:hypothetical protein